MEMNGGIMCKPVSVQQQGRWKVEKENAKRRIFYNQFEFPGGDLPKRAQ